MRSVRGNNRPYRSHKFTGILVCGRCGYGMTFNNGNGYNRYICQSKYWPGLIQNRCDRAWGIAENKVQTWLNDRLTQMLAQHQPDLLCHPDEPTQGSMVETLRAEVASVELQIRRLITQQSTAPDNVQNFYHEQIERLSIQLRTLRSTLQLAEHDAHQPDIEVVEQAYAELSDYDSLEAFWASDELTINRLLHRLLGRYRLVVVDHQIVGTRDTL